MLGKNIEKHRGDNKLSSYTYAAGQQRYTYNGVRTRQRMNVQGYTVAHTMSLITDILKARMAIMRSFQFV